MKICMFVLGCVSLTSCFICEKHDRHCYTSLNIDYKFTMYLDGQIYSKDRKLFQDNQNSTDEIPIEDVITADGYTTPKQVIVANGTMPGPDIVLYENQKITVLVNNRLFHEAVTIHWHGIDQLGWPYMDGVAYVTQCPILPGQSFNYTFQPTFPGSYWYHSHMGIQRDMGLFGAFIVLKQSEEIPFSNQFILQLQEWNHLYSSVEVLEAQQLPDSGPQTVLLNGQGELNNNEAPLQMFFVDKSEKYKFRVIGVGSKFPLLLSIPGLKLNVTETDGFEIQPVEVDEIIVYPAERYDFTIDLNYALDEVYNITVDVLYSKFLSIRNKAVGLAFLNVSNRNSLSSQLYENNITRVLNCPFHIYPNRSNTQCIPVSELTYLTETPDSKFFGLFDFENEPTSTAVHFLNFGFPNDVSSINGRKFIWPTVSALSQPKEVHTSCDDCEAEETCSCSHSINLKSGSEVIMVLLNLGTGMFISHPIHMHGHTYEVLKMGFPTTSSDTTDMTPTSDIQCSDTLPNNESSCSSAKWANSSWNTLNNIEGINLENPLRKDTTVVPWGGYTVIRIRATNPGVWFMHCHIDEHMINGMALMLNESFDVLVENPKYAVPKGFPSCHSFLNTASGNVQTLSLTGNGASDTNVIAVSVVAAILFLALIVGVGFIIKFKRCGSGQNQAEPPREMSSIQS